MSKSGYDSRGANVLGIEVGKQNNDLRVEVLMAVFKKIVLLF